MLSCSYHSDGQYCVLFDRRAEGRTEVPNPVRPTWVSPRCWHLGHRHPCQSLSRAELVEKWWRFRICQLRRCNEDPAEGTAVWEVLQAPFSFSQVFNGFGVLPPGWIGFRELAEACSIFQKTQPAFLQSLIPLLALMYFFFIKLYLGGLYLSACSGTGCAEENSVSVILAFVYKSYFLF